MSEHDQFAEDLALYALGSLQGDELAVLEKHLEECASCRRELEQLRGDMGLLALASAASAPPQRARAQLMAAVAKEPRAVREPRQLRPWWLPIPWFAAGAMALLAIVFWYDKTDLQRELAKLKDDNAQQSLELTKARDVVATLTASDALRVTLVAAKAPPQPQGKAIYVRDRSSLIFIASNMPKLPAEKIYELWLIPATGDPIPAGLFKPDARGSATVVNPPLPGGVEAKAFAITVEPEAGSATPTMPIAMVGAGE
jgi:anti-sigma-K factor RskA